MLLLYFIHDCPLIFYNIKIILIIFSISLLFSCCIFVFGAELRPSSFSSGPLFNFDVHDDIRLVNDATVEKDEVIMSVLCLVYILGKNHTSLKEETCL